MYASNLSFAGLYTFPNPLANIPVGGALQADNLVANKDGVAETRRGIAAQGDAFDLTELPVGQYIDSLFSFQNRLIAISTDGKYFADVTGDFVWSERGTNFFPPPNAVLVHFQEANKNLYLTTIAGIRKAATYDTPILSSGAAFFAGAPAALDGTGVLSGAGSGFLGSMFQCAYQIVFGYVDANGNLILGSPSERILVVNSTGGSDNVDLTFTVPLGLTTSFFYQIYRTPQTVYSATPSLNVPPGAEPQLAGQFNLTAGQIAALSVTVTDVTTDALLGAALYTNPSQQGALQTNDRPPLAADLCAFSQMMFYANCQTLQFVEFSLISVGVPNGIQVGDTFVVNGVTFTGAVAQNNASQQFLIDTTGTVASNIDATARNLIQCINANASTTNVYAIYLSGYNDLPGLIELQAVSLSQAVFYTTSNRGGAFSPMIPASGTSFPSSNDSVPNGIYVSKVGQPEAVPAVNLVFVGGGDQPIYRILPLRDRVIVLKSDGVWVITGTTPQTLSITLLDSTIICIAPESARLLNNSVYCMTQQGVVSITESGVTIQSRAIEGDLLRLTTNSFPNFKSVCYGISYESERLFILGMPTTADDTCATQAFCYNWITNAWTRWPIDFSCGIVNAFDNILYLSRPVTNSRYIYQERKNYAYTDYFDDVFPVTITSVDSSGLVISISTVPDATWVGYGLSQTVAGNLYTSIVTAVDVVANTITLSLQNSTQPGTVAPWAIAAAGIWVPIPVTVTQAPITGGFPHYLKSWTRVDLWFNIGNFPLVNTYYTTDVTSTGILNTLLMPIIGLFGYGPYGGLPYGGTYNLPQKVQTLVPTDQALACWIMPTLNVSFPGARFTFLGSTATYDIVSDVSG